LKIWNDAEDGKFVGDSDVGEFWSLFGGFAPIPRDSPSFQKQSDTPSVKLFWWVFKIHLCQFNLFWSAIRNPANLLMTEISFAKQCILVSQYMPSNEKKGI
jgi:hypothetical protein